ncbi:MAG: GDP-mannose 4,6-dehydratase [Acidimicrobiales bacterium]|nr:MAG: GDP-mannose 4,6-dehydratase [Acidimicrobiales bacterium]
MRVVVTGGAGFIGANLCRLLLATPEVSEVVVVDDFSSGLKENVQDLGELRVVEGSILDLDLLCDVLAHAQAVVHLAARPSVPRSLADPLATHHVNATGTANLFEAARRTKVGHVVVASSSSVYGANPVLPKHEDLAPAPLSPYAASKLATEQYALAYAHSFGMKVLALRFFNVFGPLQLADHAYAAIIPVFISSALAGRPLPVHGDGLQSRDFTYVGDLVEILKRAVVGRVTAPGPVNLAFGTRRTLLDVVAILEQILSRPLTRAHEPPRPGDVRHSQADQSRLRALFPNLEPTPLDQGLRRTVEWFRGSSHQ